MIKLAYDLHIHTCLSPCADKEMMPDTILGMALMNGLDVIAITDHNSSKNCGAVMERSTDFGILVIPGMELCTAEEIHVIFLFQTLKDAMRFDSYVYSRLQKIKNRPDVFGEQLFVDSNNKIVGQEENLLLNATTISYDEIFDLAKEYNALLFPAHIDRPSYSLTSRLGIIPEHKDMTCIEIKNKENLPDLLRTYPFLEKCHILYNSDAHYPEQISERKHFLEVEKEEISEIFKVFRDFFF
jgi:PHP family Zn ribbon phosphoesterase